MGIWDKLRGELVDVIEWLDDTHDTMVYRFERAGNEIKYGARLVVREGQCAVFINEGHLADIFYPGTHTLDTQNIPILSTLQGWKHGFESPFKAEVYFCSTTQFTDLKWGTPGPCTMRDPDFGIVRVTAFGIFGLRIQDPATFIREIVGTDGRFSTHEIVQNLRGKIGVMIKEAMPEMGIPVVELEGKVRILGENLRDRLDVAFIKLGLELTEVQVQDIGLPEVVENAIDKGGAMRAIGNMQAYTQYEAASAIEDFAKNPGAGGMAGAGLGAGMGMGLGQQMAQTMSGAGQQRQPPSGPAGPPPLPPTLQIFVADSGQSTGPFDMNTLRGMVQSGRLTRDTLVWKDGMANWAPANEVPELSSLFGSMPPPVPPAPPAG